MAFLGLRGLIAQSLRDGDQAQALRLCRARLRAQAADAVGRAFAVRHAGADRPVAGGAGHARRRHAPQGGERRPRPHPEAPCCWSSAAAPPSATATTPKRWHWRAKPSAWRPSASPSPSRLAELQIKTGDARRAMKTLERGWSLAPHPDLADALSQGVGRERSAEAGRRGAQARRHKSPTISKAIWRSPRRRSTPACGARRGGISTTAGGTNPSVRVCRMMAERRGARRSPTRPRCATGWRARPRHRPTSAWRCGACGAHHETWRSVCESCGAFGTLHWRAPGHLRPDPAAWARPSRRSA